jgi:isoleucyl-tRNA synthetase
MTLLKLQLLSISLVTVAFSLVDDQETSLLAWTTTPWTLPSNLTLCVHPDFTYVKIHDEQRSQNFIIHESLLRTLYKNPATAQFKELARFKGSDMKGWRYVPLFDYFTEKVRLSPLIFPVHARLMIAQKFGNKAFRVLTDTYVTDADGTGIVHQAPGFGEDDHRVCIENGVLGTDEMPPCPIDDSGKFTAQVPDFAGQYVKVRANVNCLILLPCSCHHEGGRSRHPETSQV